MERVCGFETANLSYVASDDCRSRSPAAFDKLVRRTSKVLSGMMIFMFRRTFKLY